MIDHPDGLDYMAFCFAVFGAPSGISGAESRIGRLVQPAKRTS